jgi:hypothetical protein
MSFVTRGTMKATVSYRRKFKFLPVLSTFTVRFMVKFDIRDMHIMLFSTVEFRENRR